MKSIVLMSFLVALITTSSYGQTSFDQTLEEELVNNYIESRIDQKGISQRNRDVNSLFIGSVDTELEEIKSVLNHYIEGTANGQPKRLELAFQRDFNLYFIKDEELQSWSGKQYISNVKEGVQANRIGEIISIDYEKDAAVAKIEILMPDSQLLYTDYLLLLKIESRWKIIHKIFTNNPI